MPRRLVSILEGEALINDATALVAYRIAIGTGTFSLLDAGWDFVWKAAGGIAIGLAVGWVIIQVRKRLDDPLVENTIGLLSGYAAYVPAEHLELSAVLSAVTVGCYVGWQAPKIASPATRLQGFGMWELLVFLMNAFLFTLVGLQLPVILDTLRAEWLGYAVAVSAAVVLTRLVWNHSLVFVIRAIDRRESQRARRGNWQGRTIVGWAGMRGAVSLAAALALPFDFEQRDLLIFITFAVIFVTLVLQGLTLPPLIRWLGVQDDGTEEEREELKARLYATKAALARIDELAGEEWTRDDTIERHARRLRVPQAAAGGARGQDRGRRASRTARSPTRRSCARCSRRSAPPSSGSATRARSPTTSCTGSSASSTWRTSGSKSNRGEVGGLDQPVAQRADHRLDLLHHPLAVQLGQRAVDQVGPAIELDVEALGDLVGHRDLAPDVALAAAQAHPPGLGSDGLPVDRVDEVLAAGGAGVQIVLVRTRGRA